MFVVLTFMFYKCSYFGSLLLSYFVTIWCFRSFSPFCFASVRLMFQILFVFLSYKWSYFESLRFSSPFCFANATSLNPYHLHVLWLFGVSNPLCLLIWWLSNVSNPFCLLVLQFSIISNHFVWIDMSSWAFVEMNFKL